MRPARCVQSSTSACRSTFLGLRGRLLIITKAPPARVADAITTGKLRCPCSGRLRLWGFARSRWVRDRRHSGRLRPRRGRCTVCRQTHVILPDWVVLRRLDRVEVIGSALTASSRGRSFRKISDDLQLPPTTVRDWIRRFVARTAAHPPSPGATTSSPFDLSALVTAVPDPSSSPGRLWRDANRSSHGQLLV
jgi:hypothetical protein